MDVFSLEFVSLSFLHLEHELETLAPLRGQKV